MSVSHTPISFKELALRCLRASMDLQAKRQDEMIRKDQDARRSPEIVTPPNHAEKR